MYLLKKLYRWIRFRHGFGVHSPFAFSLINDVIEEDYSYYFYKDVIDRIRRLRYNLYFNATSLKNNRLFFRLSNRFRPKHILLIGSESAEAILYFQGAHSERKCTLIESVSSKSDAVLTLIENDSLLSVIEVKNEEIDDAVQTQLLKTEFDMVLIHHAMFARMKQNTLSMCLKKRKEPHVVVVDGITQTEEIRTFWKDSILNTEVSITFDLISIGIIIINSKLKKQNYKLPF